MTEEKIIHSLPGVYDMLEHTGDVYIKAKGSSIIELLENSGIALFDTMVNTKKVEPLVVREVSASGFDLENLLYKWLEELLILYYSENLVCGKISVDHFIIKKINEALEYTVSGKAYCEKFQHDKHEPRVEVKSPTYSLMRIVKTENEWIAYFVLDI
ncbi:MAG: archease [Desulfurococcaceae archaeon]